MDEREGRDTQNQQSVTLMMSCLGEVSLPEEVFRRIRNDLPRPLARMKNDLLDRQNLAIREHGFVTLQTRAFNRIWVALYQAGYAVEIVHGCEQPQAHMAVSDTRPQNTIPVDEITRTSLIFNRYGQMVCHNDQHRWKVIIDLIAAFPEVRFILPVVSRKVADEVYCRLTRFFPDQVEFVCGIRPRASRRILVTTFWTGTLIDPSRCAVLVPYFPPSFPEWLKIMLIQPAGDRFYVFRTRMEHLARADEEQLEARVGLPLFEHSFLAPPVWESIIEPVSGPVVGSNRVRGPLSRYPATFDRRMHYWRHSSRNLQILNKFADELRTAVSVNRGQNPVPMKIIVENQEHRSILLQLLNASRESLQLPQDIETFDDYVLTLISANSTTPLNSVLIWGVGGPASRWLDQWLLASRKTGRTVRIVDFCDEFDIEAARMARDRMAAYQKQGLTQLRNHRSPVDRSLNQRDLIVSA